MKSHMLIILTKYPIAGKVKTRLGESIGMQTAARFQDVCLRQLITTHRDQRNYSLMIGLQGEEYLDTFSKEYTVPKSQIFLQQGTELGAIMHHALSYGLSLSKHVCLIGSDTPLLTTQTVSRAFQHLQHRDSVVGPSDDGGYYLIGASQSLQDVLVGMQYSTSTVYQETLQRINTYNYSVATLPSHLDIDTYEALQQAYYDDTTGWVKNITQTLQIDMGT